MIYRILYNHQEIYGPDLDMAVLNPTLEVELNAAGKLEFTLPITREGGEDPIWNNIQVFQGEVEVYEGDDCIWFGRPLQIIRDWNNHKRVLCEGALAYFNDTVQRTKEYKQNEQGVKDTPLYTGEPYTASKYKKGFFNALIDIHNSQVQKESGSTTPDTNRLIEVGEVDVDNELVWRKTDYETTAECLQSMCLDTNGGYFILRKEKVPGTISDYVSKIDWRKEMPYGTDQPVAFGLNLLDISQDLNGADLCTVLIPTGEDDMNLIEYRTVDEQDERYRGCTHVKGDDFIVHTAGFAKYGKILKQKSFNGSSDEIATRGDLFNKATDWLNEQNTDETTIECSAADLHYLNEYSDYGKLRIGQMVTVVDSVHGVNRTLPIFKVSMNLDSGVKQITMGTPPKKELTDIVKPKTSSSTRGSNGGSADSTGDSGGSGGSGGSASVPVKDVQTKVPGGSYHSVVEKKKAKIDLSGYVTDITMDGGDSIVDRQTGKADIQVPVKGVEVDDVSIVNASGIAKINSNNFGKVDDVRVDDISVVANKIANINSNNFGKVDDVRVNGTSVVSNKVATLNGLIDGYNVFFKIPVQEFVRSASSVSPIWIHVYDKEINAYYNADTKELRLNELESHYQRTITWGAGFKDFYHNYGPDPVDVNDAVEGSYVVQSTFPIDTLTINGNDIKYDILPDKTNQSLAINVVGGTGIDVKTSVGSYSDTTTATLTLSSTRDFDKPAINLIFSDDSKYESGETSGNVEYIIPFDGCFLINFISSDVHSCTIWYKNEAGEMIYPTLLVNNNTTDVTYQGVSQNVRAITHLVNLTTGSRVVFVRDRNNITFDGLDVSLRSVFQLENIDVTGVSVYTSEASVDFLNTNTNHRYDTLYRTMTLDQPYSSHGMLSVVAGIKYFLQNTVDEDDFDVQTGTTTKNTTVYSGNRPYAERDSYGDIYYSGPYTRSNATCKVSFDRGPTAEEGQTYQFNTSIPFHLSDYTNNTNSGRIFFYGLMLVVPKFVEPDEGYVTEAQMNNAISTAVGDAVSTLESNFQDGVDAIYDACVAKGSTPASQSLSDVVQGIMDIPQGGGSGDTVSYSSSSQEAPLNVELVATTWTVTNMSFSSEVIV